jgi:hypothetical protein
MKRGAKQLHEYHCVWFPVTLNAVLCITFDLRQDSKGIVFGQGI